MKKLLNVIFVDWFFMIYAPLRYRRTYFGVRFKYKWAYFKGDIVQGYATWPVGNFYQGINHLLYGSGRGRIYSHTYGYIAHPDKKAWGCRSFTYWDLKCLEALCKSCLREGRKSE